MTGKRWSTLAIRAFGFATSRAWSVLPRGQSFSGAGLGIQTWNEHQGTALLQESSRMYWGTWVVFPHPVSPARRMT